MLKIVIDTNLFVSATLTEKGNPAKILDLVRERKIELFISKPILKEIREVLFYPHIEKIHQLSRKEIGQKLKGIIEYANLTSAKLKLAVVKDDPSDDKFIVCAVEGNADYIISGDHHLKDLKNYQGVKIVSPAEFSKILKS